MAIMLAALCCLLPVGVTHAQEDFIPQRIIDLSIDSGVVSAPRSDDPDDQQLRVVYSEIVSVPRAPWLRLHFGHVLLSGVPVLGTDSILRITSLKDGSAQTLNVSTLHQWQNSSCFFNGSQVLVEILAQPGTGPNRVVIERVTAGVASEATPMSICGGTDDRVLQSDPRVARAIRYENNQMLARCTAWLFNNREKCLISAGHCVVGSLIMVEFNVPLSLPDGTPQFAHPDDQYPVDWNAIQYDDTAWGDDWAVIGVLANSNTGLSPLAAQGASFTLANSAPTPMNQTVRLRGYGTVELNQPPPAPPNEWNRVLKISEGPYVGVSYQNPPPYLIAHRADSTSGDSGSAIKDLTTGLVIGVHTHGGCDNQQWVGNHGTAIEHPSFQYALLNPTGTCAQSSIWHVPADFPNIQSAINAAMNGDEIIVAPGTYNENIDFLGKRIHLRSSAGSASTVINGTGGAPVVRCGSGETHDTILEGFTITATTFRGMIISDSSATVIDCVFNNTSGSGGGVHAVGNLFSQSYFIDCRFIGNSGTRGGGMYKGGSGHMSIVNCHFEENTATEFGGGLRCSGGAVPFITVSNTTFRNNHAVSAGGGVFNVSSSGTDSVFSDCVFEGNTTGANGSGGGMYNNTTSDSARLINCVFTDNQAGWGGAIANQFSSPFIMGCEFRSNSAITEGGAIFNFANSTPSIGATLFCDNTPEHIVGPWNNLGGNQFLANCPGSGSILHVPVDYPTIQLAINAANDGDEVLVAPGTYYENLVLLGKAIHVRSSGGPAVTTIDGQGNDSVIYISGQAGPSTVIEGFTLTNGSQVNGGGLYIVQSSPTIINCIMRNNEAHNGSGGAVYAQQSSSAFIDCTFEDNISAYWAGGVMLSNTGSEHPTLTNCTFRRNISGTNGGGLMVISGNADVNNCTFIANVAVAFLGGALHGANGASININDCQFEWNVASYAGGAVYYENSTSVILNTYFKGNYAPVSGGGAEFWNSSVSIGDSMFCENRIDHITGPFTDLGGNTFITGSPTSPHFTCP